MSQNNFTEKEKEEIIAKIFNQKKKIYSLFFESGDNSYAGLKKSEIGEILSILKVSRGLEFRLSDSKEKLVNLLTSTGFNATPQPHKISSSPFKQPLQVEIQPDSFLAPSLGITIELTNLLEEH
ncbi:hypothetical protein ACTA71_012350 [Dictyostelium dimigraforme]